MPSTFNGYGQFGLNGNLRPIIDGNNSIVRNNFCRELNIRGIRLIHTGLSQAVQKWSGGEPEEQENLIAMRDNFYRLILEHQFDSMN